MKRECEAEMMRIIMYRESRNETRKKDRDLPTTYYMRETHERLMHNLDTQYRTSSMLWGTEEGKRRREALLCFTSLLHSEDNKVHWWLSTSHHSS